MISALERSTSNLLVTMSNPTSLLPSYETDTITQANNSYFCLPTGRTPAEIKCKQVVVKKENSGDEGSKQFTSNYTVVTEALKPGFGAAKRFVDRSKDGKDNGAGNTNYTYIQEFFVAT